ncbi:MAG: M56 family metallopeptidase [Rhodothermales bacterium]
MTPLHDLFASDLSPWLSMMAQWFIKGALVLAAAGLLTSLLRKRAAAVRCLVWCAALLSLLALPVLSLALPSWHVPVLPSTADVAPTPLADVHAEAPLPTATRLLTIEPQQTLASCEESELAVLPPSAHAYPDVHSDTDVHTDAAAEAAPLLADVRAESSDALEVSSASGFGTEIKGMLAETNATAWLFLAWFVGVWLVLGRLAVAHIGVRWLLGRARRVEDDAWREQAEKAARRLGISRNVRLRWSPYTAVPLCVGVFRPAIVLPIEASNLDWARREAVLLHELAHIRRRDVLTHLLAQITCALHWFNPLVWVAARQLSIERERACDDVVLTAGTRATDYAETLLDAARSLKSGRWTTSAALAMARRSQLEGRLLSILDAGPHRRTASPAGSILALVIVACIVLPLAALTPAQAQEAPEAPEPLTADTTKVKRPPPPPPARWMVDPPAPVVAPYVVVHPDVDVDPFIMPDVDVDMGDFEFYFEPEDFEFEFDFGDFDRDPMMNEVLGDTLSIEQLIRLRRYGLDGDFIRGIKELGFTDLTLGELTNLAKYGADPEYIRGIRAAGFTDLDPEDLARMAKYGLDAEFVSAVREAGYSTTGVEGLISMAKYGADADFIAAMRAAGLTDVSAEDLATMAKYGVDEDLIATLNRLGYTGLGADDFVLMAKYGVDEDLIVALQELGYTELSAEDVTRMAKYGVDPDFVRTMAQTGYTDLSADDLVAMSKYGVDEDFVTFLAEQGYTDVTVDDLITASKYGVDEDLVGAMMEAGLDRLSIDELAELSKYGVDEEYVEELREAGLTNFTAEQLIEMRRRGIDGDFVKSMQGN